MTFLTRTVTRKAHDMKKTFKFVFVLAYNDKINQWRQINCITEHYIAIRIETSCLLTFFLISKVF